MPIFGMQNLWRQAMTERSRTTVLQPLQWMLGLCLLATVGALREGADKWLLVGLVFFDTIAVALFVGSYIYLLPRDRDALRSERFALQKLAIEKGLQGDTLRGIELGNIDVETDIVVRDNKTTSSRESQ